MTTEGENLGSMTIYVVDRGADGGGAGGGAISPGGAGAPRMPSQHRGAIEPSDGGAQRVVMQRAAAPRAGGGWSPEGAAGALAMSTRSPWGAATRVASMSGGVGLAAPVLLSGAGVAALGGGMIALRMAINRLTDRIGGIAAFAPATLGATLTERVSSFRRMSFRGQAGDADFAAFTRQLTRMSNALTPLVSAIERAGARVLTSILGVLQKVLEHVATLAMAAGAALSVLPGTLGSIGQTLNKIARQILDAQNMGSDPNDIFRRQIDALTRGNSFGTVPATPIYPWWKNPYGPQPAPGVTP